MKDLATQIEALHVGPDEVLIIRIKEPWENEHLDDLMDAVSAFGLENRVLVFAFDAEMVAVRK